MIIMSEDDQRAIKESIVIIEENKIAFGEYFYDCLFQLAPIIKQLFVTDRRIIELHLSELLILAGTKVNTIEDLEMPLMELGNYHKQFNIVREQFPVVKSALILTLEHFVQERCPCNTLDAWGKLYDEISCFVIKGLEEDR